MPRGVLVLDCTLSAFKTRPSAGKTTERKARAQKKPQKKVNKKKKVDKKEKKKVARKGRHPLPITKIKSRRSKRTAK